ncbi:MAG: hypothetical protein M3540_06570 [Actinomycetota bacterium]|nr:hypothetical protein [Actinomycetota bacterium]
MAAAKTVAARSQFVAEIDGRTVVVLEGARFPAGGAIVKGREDLFEPIAARPKARPKRKTSGGRG